MIITFLKSMTYNNKIIDLDKFIVNPLSIHKPITIMATTYQHALQGLTILDCNTVELI